MPRISDGTRVAAPAAPKYTGPTRTTLKPWDVFRTVFKDGKTGKKEYIHLGHNGKYWSLNVGNGELAYARNNNKAVKKTGMASVKTELVSVGQQRKTTRRAVKDNEVFQVTADGPLYAHLGTLNDGRYVAVNLGSQDYALGERGDKNVTIVGNYEIAISRKGF